MKQRAQVFRRYHPAHEFEKMKGGATAGLEEAVDGVEDGLSWSHVCQVLYLEKYRNIVLLCLVYIYMHTDVIFHTCIHT